MLCLFKLLVNIFIELKIFKSLTKKKTITFYEFKGTEYKEIKIKVMTQWVQTISIILLSILCHYTDHIYKETLKITGTKSIIYINKDFTNNVE